MQLAPLDGQWLRPVPRLAQTCRQQRKLLQTLPKPLRTWLLSQHQLLLMLQKKCLCGKALSRAKSGLVLELQQVPRADPLRRLQRLPPQQLPAPLPCAVLDWMAPRLLPLRCVPLPVLSPACIRPLRVAVIRQHLVQEEMLRMLVWHLALQPVGFQQGLLQLLPRQLQLRELRLRRSQMQPVQQPGQQ